MLVDLVPLGLEGLEVGAPRLRNPGDAASDLAVLLVGASLSLSLIFLFPLIISFHVCV